MKDDDIDDLLDEIESKYLPKNLKNSKEFATNKNSKNIYNADNPKFKKTTDELSDLLNDIIIEPQKGSKSVNEPIAQLSLDNKCLPVCIGGTNSLSGLSTILEKKCCPKLRCTNCDFNLIVINNRAWDKSVDYLFLRNNMPDVEKMKSKLVVKKGVRAYACQCQHRSIMELTEIKNDLNLKWVCGRH